MAIIALEGIKIFAKHGFYEEETILGNEFIIDVAVDISIEEASEEDDLFKSVNYETLFYLCKVEMKEPAKLIETVAQRIVDRINTQFDNVRGIQLKLTKLNPPLDGIVAAASIQITDGIFDFPKLDSLKVLKDFAEDMEELEELE